MTILSMLVGGIMLAARPANEKDYAAQANERVREQMTAAGVAKATKDIPAEMYERAKKLYPEEFWKEPEPGQKVTPIKLLKTVPPKYPLVYRIVATEGEIWVAFIVDPKGKVTEVKPLTEFESQFVDAAVNAVKKWKFEPATRDGKPVGTLVTVPLQFRLEKR
jgi:TonB family protein